eukprot:SM000101S09306  [mRNA]  locus=s101:397156:399565:- [translate_table: standard]
MVLGDEGASAGPPTTRPTPDVALLKHFTASGSAVAVATAVTHPIDVVKVHMQLDGVDSRRGSRGLLQHAVLLVQQKGTAALYSGIVPALLRSVTYGCLRLGLYEPCRNVLAPEQEHQTIVAKIAAGILSGSFATAVTNPLDVVKVHLQVSRSKVDSRKRLLGVLRNILARDGVPVLWKGVWPSMARASALTAAQCATYDECKQTGRLWRWRSALDPVLCWFVNLYLKLTTLRGYLNMQALARRCAMSEGLTLHLSASMLAGFAATSVAAPFDTVKTRMMAVRLLPGSTRPYRHSFDCAYRIVQTEGLLSLYKGWTANYARLGPQTAITFVVYEKLRHVMGLSSL